MSWQCKKCVYKSEFISSQCPSCMGGEWAQVLDNPPVRASEQDHPCKETCSGWKQGFEAGRANERERIRMLLDDENVTYDGTAWWQLYEKILNPQDSDGAEG